MLDVVLWENHEDICRLNFLKKEDNSIEFICPNPESADCLNDIIKRELSLFRATTVTISNFIQRELRAQANLEKVKNYKFLSKPEILLHLGLLWRKAFPKEPEYLFLKIYKLFSELRSFTLDRSLFEEAIELCSGESFKIALHFWDYLENNNFVDEQKAYGILSEIYWDKKDVEPKTYVIWGFDFLSGLQIDFIKSISENHNVFIPFPREVYLKSSYHDWIRWIIPFDENKKDINYEQLNRNSFKVIPVEKDFFGEELNNYFKNNREKKERIDITIADETLSYADVNIIPFDCFSFKQASDLFSPLLDEEFKRLYEKFFIQKSFGPLQYNFDVLYTYLKGKLKKEIKTEKCFRRIKILCLLIKNFEKLEGLLFSQENKVLESYYFYLVKNITELELPRNFSFPLTGSSLSGKIKSLKQFDTITEENINILMVTDFCKPFKPIDVSYSDELFDLLSSIGPLKRGDFNGELNKKKIKEVLKKKNCTLFIDSGVLKKDPFWIELIDDEDHIEIEERTDTLIKKNFLDEKVEKRLNDDFVWSPSSLQTFFDCPRKFYFKYIEKINNRFSPKKYLGFDQRGIIEHKIIETYLEKYRVWNESEFSLIVEETLKNHLDEKEISLELLDYKRYILEISNYARRGVESLLSLGPAASDLSLHFEFEPQKKNRGKRVKGVIDLLLNFGDGIGILDFKRSKGGIPTIKDFTGFNHFQIWFYLSNFNINLNDLILFGFLNLDDPKSSLIYYRPEAIDSHKRMELDKFLEVTGAKKWDSLMGETIGSYLKVEDNLFNEAHSDRRFLAKPRVKKVCNFCEFNNVCEKK